MDVWVKWEVGEERGIKIRVFIFFSSVDQCLREIEIFDFLLILTNRKETKI
jgi:hypothetical protein